jgi:3-phenylpropionate/trans-cinnamate dioxygenase ferredoxin reductase component
MRRCVAHDDSLAQRSVKAHIGCPWVVPFAVMSERTIVIVGAGLGAARAAVNLRKEGFDGRIVMLAEEHEQPYERPPLSKDYLRGTKSRDEVRVKTAAAWAAEGTEVLTGTRATEIDLRARHVQTDDGQTFGFWRLLLATGAEARPLTVPGGDLPGVLTLRTFDDADTIRTAASEAGEVAVIGGGWIGAEVAASLRQLDVAVTMIMSSSLPLERVLGPEIATVYRNLHLEHGVRIVPDAKVEAVVGQGAAAGLRLADGSLVAATVIVAGVGARPRDELARAAGLTVSDGVEVDEYLRTSDPDVFAIGDVAAAWHPLLVARVRVEHWDTARRHGIAVAKSMVDSGEPYRKAPYFYSDQYDLDMEYVGHPAKWDRLLFRGEPASGSFCAFWLDGAKVVAGLNARVPGVSPTIAKLIESDVTIDPSALADADRPLESLLPSAT